MSPAELQQRLSAVGSDIDWAATLLVSPAPVNLDLCSQLLESASIELADLHSHVSPSDANTRTLAEAERVQRGVDRAAALLHTSARFHQDWNRILGAMCTGYQAGGDPAAVVHRPRLRVEG